MLNENIKNLRKNKGLTQEEMAIRLNVVRQTVSKWEKGHSVPDAEMLVKLADIFEVPVSQLLGSRIEPDAQTDALAEQLARINEQLVIKNNSTGTEYIAKQFIYSNEFFYYFNNFSISKTTIRIANQLILLISLQFYL